MNAARRAEPRGRWIGREWREDALLLPALFLAAAVVGVPILRVVQLSLSRVELDGGLRIAWNGLGQFVRMWQDGRWWNALGNTSLFTLLSIASEMVLGVAGALLLHERFRGRGAARALVVLPWALPTAVMSLGWAWIFNDAFGVMNDLLLRLGALHHPVAWLGRPATAMAALVVADVWKTTPFVTLVVLAGLQGISVEVQEAAALDGLTGRQRLRHIVLPLLGPALLVALVFRIIQAFGAFDVVYVMTGGGPGGSTETVSLYAYKNYFRYLDFAYGSAVAVQSVMLVGLLTAVLMRLARGSGGTR